jgi:tRNA-splicing ligase RtcB
MVRLHDLIRIRDQEWEIPISYRADMRVPVRLYASRELLEQIVGDKSLDQAVNAATLPGLVGHVVVMPDMHQGYGFPIGGVAATQFPQGVVSPGAIGYDINCGVRLLASDLEAEAASGQIETLVGLLDRYCPSGVGKEGVVRLSQPELERVLREGSRWALKNGYASETDLVHTEENGCLEGANPAKVSERAKSRGRDQIGSVGAGNHFVEVDVVEAVFDPESAAAFGLREGCLVAQIHCGSRGLGHQVCSDAVQEFQGAVRRYGIELPDRELVCAPMDSPEGQAYLGAMRAAANFAFANRQILAHSIRRAFEETYAGN